MKLINLPRTKEAVTRIVFAPISAGTYRWEIQDENWILARHFEGRVETWKWDNFENERSGDWMEA